MSHGRKRKEDNCLNCGARVQGRYCQQCGQENIEPQQRVSDFLFHFMNDVTHFDGKFFSTLNVLLFHPGRLTQEYVAGRRASYLDPVRMYLFTSFIFFLIFIPSHEIEKVSGLSENVAGERPAAEVGVNTGRDTSAQIFRMKYTTTAEYDSLIKIGKVKDNWISQLYNRRLIHFNEKYKNESEDSVLTLFFNTLMHQFPKLLFVSLPFTALILYFLYRRRRQYYYVAHAVFTIHLFITIFIVMLFGMLLSFVIRYTGWEKLEFIGNVLVLLVFYYIYKAMRKFYGQGRRITIFKYLVFLLLFGMLNVFLLAFFGVFSFFQM